MKNILLLSAIFAASAAAQTGTATISGQVADTTGALVPGAVIRVVNVGTGVERKSATNASGLYNVELLQPGEYELTAQKEGFRSLVRKGVTLQVDQRSRQDFSLSVGGLAEAVEVTAQSEQFLKPVSSELGEVITSKPINELPLNGRGIMTLILLNAGATTSLGSGFKQFGSDFNLNGARSNQNGYMIDGMDNMEFSMSRPNNYLQVEAIDEFNILTNNYSAEYGKALGGIVNVRMRSGTNTFHGSLFEFFRNDKIDASDFFSNRNNRPKPPLRYNQFGGSLGGPIIHNKTFFFASYQGQRTQTNTLNTAGVPPVRWRNGDFADLLAGGVQIFDPAAVTDVAAGVPVRTPFPGNIIPQSRWNSAGKKVLDLYPTQNLPGNVSNYLFLLRSKINENDIDTKVDHNFNSTNTLSVRYNFGNPGYTNDSLFGSAGGPGASYSSGVPEDRYRNQSVAGTYTRIVTPSLVNDFRFGYIRGTRRAEAFTRDTPDFNTKLGIPGINNGADFTAGLAAISFGGYNLIGGNRFFPLLLTAASFQIVDNVVITRGRHSLKTGINIQPRRLRLFQANAPRGAFNFDAQFSSQGGRGGNSIASGLLGYYALGERDIVDHENDQRTTEFSAYLQDDFRVNKRLTLSLGLRYDLFPPLVEAEDRQANFNPFTKAMDIAGKNGIPRGLVATDRNNFGPRIGFAYELTGDQKTVLRGGYGISYFSEVSNQGSLTRLVYNPPFYYRQQFNQSGIQNPVRSLTDGLPAPTPPNPQAPAGAVIHYDPSLRDPYSQQWNLDIQRQVVSNLLIDVAYAGSRGVHLLNWFDLNQPRPGPTQVFPVSNLIGFLRATSNSGNSAYHSLQIKANKRFSSGFSFLGSYTWSKTIDDANGLWGNTSGALLPQDSLNYKAERGLSSYDTRHRFVLSYIFELPFGRGKRFLSNAAPVLNHLLGGWQTTGIFTAASGTPFNPVYNATNRANTPNYDNQFRPNRIADGNLPRSERNVDRWFDPLAFRLPDLYTFGNAGRNVLVGPGMVNLDAGFFKTFTLTERFRLQFRSEFFNLTNSVHFTIPTKATDNANSAKIFGLSSPARQIQFALKLLF